MSASMTILFQFKNRHLNDPGPRAPTTNIEQWLYPAFPDLAPAQQIWFCHTSLSIPKLASALNYATGGPQVSFVVDPMRLSQMLGF